jgi:tryptophan 2,3-dioxygenase
MAKVQFVDNGTDYSTYLKINDLLTLQVPLTADAPDELLFIVVHQAYELWFKVMIDELRRASKKLHARMPWSAVWHLRRLVQVEGLLLGHLQLLDTMSPEGFLEFRDPLNPASGFQSFQFRAIEFLSGGGNKAMLHFELFDEEVRAWLTDISQELNIWDGFVHSLTHLVGVGAEEDVLSLLRALYLQHETPELSALHSVAELLVDHDENLAKWRQQHMLMAGRQIGRRPGTGGSEGMAYLDTTLQQRLYPQLWEVRSVL